MATTLISEIQRDKRFRATCPVCMEDFALSDAVLFALGSEPPAEAKAALNAMRARIKERKEVLRQSWERMDEIESDLRQIAAKAGLQATKRLLRKIDPVFSGAG